MSILEIPPQKRPDNFILLIYEGQDAQKKHY